MIHFFTTAQHPYTVGDYLKSWAGPSHPVVKMLAYERLPTILPRGTYIFSDLERLSRAQTALAGEVWNQLDAAREGIRLLNHPVNASRRLPLLERLHEDGRNAYRAFRATDRRLEPRFPVFVRRAGEHEGSFTGLLRDQNEVDDAIVRMLLAGVDVHDILIVEFCDTSRQGVFRKYSAFKVGEHIIPRHLLFSQKWVLKVPDLVDGPKIEEEREYLESNPHARELDEIFDIAEIDYGRIDYGLLDNRIQVWEINSNPIVMYSRDHYKRERLPLQDLFASKIRQAFESIDSPVSTQPMVTISLSERARRICDGR